MPDLSALSDAELGVMTDRAWREAARCWAEYRSGDPSIKPMLASSAEMAEAWWSDLVTEQDQRLDLAARVTEALSADRYTTLID